ncbi:MAG: hypothetical protein M1823_004403 [Watsoniomyces obsoletus]|nr:MAG: hypothetical protein M1823_004403 [Watsoniomyces obsoletus]
MSRNNDEQFKFLISCIRHANNSKVDFAAVARECGIVSKGAAAKRYERMMKAHGISPSTPPARSTPVPSSGRRDDPASAKKRKLEQFSGEMENSTVDDDGGVTGIKNEFGLGDVDIKEEDPDAVVVIDDNMPFFPSSSGTSYDHLGSRSNFSSYVPTFQEYGFESFDPQVQQVYPLEMDSSAGERAGTSGGNGRNMTRSEAILISD